MASSTPVRFGRLLVVAVALILPSPMRAAAADFLEALDAAPLKAFAGLDLDKLAAEDALRDEDPGQPKRFAVGRVVDATVENAGQWTRQADGSWLWQLRVRGEGAAHLNFGFRRFALPPGAALHLVGVDGTHKVGPFTREHMLPHGQLWTPVVLDDEVLLHLTVPEGARDEVVLELSAVNQGYRGFGAKSAACKSGACNTDVACLSDNDPWNLPRHAVGAWTRSGTDTCTGSLVNNTANDRRMLFATATHCGVDSDSAAATVVVYWNYESPTCRVPSASGTSPSLPKPASTSAGLRFLAQTANPFEGAGAAADRSDWTLLELAPPPANNDFNLYWAGWDRRAPAAGVMACAAPADPASTAGLCASIHHPGVDEKRITFVQTNLVRSNIASAQGVHWRANWDPTPPRLPNISPMPATLPPAVTEPGSSGSPLYNAEQRLVGVLSGGASYCGATSSELNDDYGGLFHAWDGLGTATTRVRDYLDPLGLNPQFIDGIGVCVPPAAPGGVTAVASGDNRITVSWTASPGADGYRIYRAAGACPASGEVPIADVGSADLAFVDTDVSGGSTYAYRIVALAEDGDCASAAGSCAAATATGACTAAPDFAGLATAVSAGTEVCGVTLEWAPATSACGPAGSVLYNVYGSAQAGFVPGPASLLAACLTGTAFVDTGLAPGVVRHYVVRAEDPGAVAGAGRCGGVEEGNAVVRSATPSGPETLLFKDSVESGGGLWSVGGSGAGANFAVVTTAANSPVSSWFVADASAVSDRTLTLRSPLALAAGLSAQLEFAHRFDTEAGYDGGVLEYSVDGGSTWADITAGTSGIPAGPQRFLAGGYAGTISTDYASPIAGRLAWTGTSGGAFVPARVALADFAGRDLLLRFRFGADSSVAGVGWWIDDVAVRAGSACTAEPPPTATPVLPTSTPVPTATATPSATPTMTATAVPTSTATPTRTETFTPTASATASETPVPTETMTPVATSTATGTATATETSTPAPTASETATPIPTPTAIPTDSPSPSPTASETPVPTETMTPVATSTATGTATATETSTPAPTASETATAIPTPTAIPTDSPSPSPTASETPVPTATMTPMATSTATATATETSTPAPTAPETATPTPTATATGPCPALPRTDCRGAGRSSLKIAASADALRDKLDWRWALGEQTTFAELGDPRDGSTEFAVCIWDRAGGAARLALEAVVPAGAVDPSGRPAWKRVGRDPVPKGWKFGLRDGSPNGIAKVDLRAGEAGRAKIAIKANGPRLVLPAAVDANRFFAQETAVVVQLHARGLAACWGAEVVADAARNTTSRYSGSCDAREAPGCFGAAPPD